jgi:membrane-associated protease RseP (regulator of RpoE activity)
VIGPRELAVDTGCLVGSVQPDVLLREDLLELLCRCGAAVPLFRDESPASADQFVIRSIRFAGLTFTNVIAFEGAFDVITLELLKDVDLTLDIPEATAWFTPVSTQPDDCIEGTFDASGLFVHFVEHDRLAVNTILPESPADAAGVREGDVITAINHRTASEWSLVQINRLLSSPGTTVVLDIVRDHDHMTIYVPLKHDQTLFNFPPEWPPENPEFNPCGPVDARQN